MFVVNLYIYVAREMFLPFYDGFLMTKTLNLSNCRYNYTYMNQYSPIYIKSSMVKWYPYSTKWDGNSGIIRHISVVVAIILLFYDDFMMTKTMDMSNWKYKTAYLN